MKKAAKHVPKKPEENISGLLADSTKRGGSALFREYDPKGNLKPAAQTHKTPQRKM